MFKVIIKQFLIFLLFSSISLFIGAGFSYFTKNSPIGVSIWIILEIICFINYSINLAKYDNNFKQSDLSKTVTQTNNTPHNNEPINKEIIIEYSDSDGEITSRKIRVKEIKYDKQKRKMVPYSLYAYCFLKKAPRTFVLNRIISAHDAETGEIITDIPNYLIK